MEKDQVSERKPESLACDCSKPHEEFLGFDHYFSGTSNKSSPSISEKSITQMHRTASSIIQHFKDDNDDHQRCTEKEEEYDDDVIAGK